MPAPIFINVHNQNARTFALVALGLTYLIFGAAVFHAIEKDREVADNQTLRAEESELQLKYNISKIDMEKLETVIIKLEPYKSSIQWDFPGSLYFAIIVLTTIGYGHSVPRTVSGKIFCMFYSLIGVPLYLVMFQAMGERINNAAKYSIKKVGRKMGLKCSEVSLSTLVPFGLFSCALTVTVGTLAFSYFEGWSLLDSGYYCVVTLTTVGFGDYVPLQNERSMRNGPGYVVFSFIYILLGLTIIGAFVNLVVLRLMVTTATGEPPKEEETQVDNVCEQRGISSALQTHSRSNSHDVDGDSGTGNGGISLPGMNGNIKHTYSLPHSTRDDQHNSSENPRPFQRRQQSFTTPREQQYGNAGRTKRSRYSDSEVYGLYNEVKRSNCANENRTVSTLDNNIYGFQNIGSDSHRDSLGEYNVNKLQDSQIRLNRNRLSTSSAIKSHSSYNHSKNGCVVCRQSCPVCHQIFSLHMLMENSHDFGQRNKSGRNACKHNSKNVNNSANTSTNDDVTNHLVVAHRHTDPSLLSTKQKNNISSSGTNLSPPKFQSSHKLLLDPNQTHLNRPRNLSMDSGYEGMLWEKTLERSVNQIPRQDKGDIGNAARSSHTSHLSKSRRWSYSDTLGTITRPSFLALPSSVESKQQDATLGRTTSTFGEHDLTTDELINKTVRYPNSFEHTPNFNMNDNSETECAKKTETQMANNEESKIDTKNFETSPITEAECKEGVSQPPAIVVTMCGDEKWQREGDPLKGNFEKCGVSEKGCRSPKDNETYDKNDSNAANTEDDFINKMCEEHYQKYKLYHQRIINLCSNQPNSSLKNCDSTKESSGSFEPTKAEHFRQVLPTTKLCSNGSVVTDNGDVLTQMPSSKETKFIDSQLQRSNSCGNSDRSQVGSNLFDSLRRIKKKHQQQNGVIRREDSRIECEEREKEKFNDLNAVRYTESDIAPIFTKRRERKKNKFDLIRIFLSNHKENGRKRYDDISTVFKERKPTSKNPTQEKIGTEMKLFRGSDPYLAQNNSNSSVRASSTQSLPDSVSIHRRDRVGVLTNGSVCT